MKKLHIICLMIMFVLSAAIQVIRGTGSQVLVFGFIFAVGIGLMLYMRWFQKFAQEVNALMPLLTEDPPRYIIETEKLLEGRKPNNIRAMLTMNVAAAHMEMGDFHAAKKKLLEIHGSALKKTNASVYFLNLTYVLIQLEDNAAAMELIQKYQKKFLSLPMGGNLPHLNAFIQIFVAIENGAWEAAEKQYLDAREAWPEKVVGVDFTILENKMTAHFGRGPQVVLAKVDALGVDEVKE